MGYGLWYAVWHDVGCDVVYGMVCDIVGSVVLHGVSVFYTHMSTICPMTVCMDSGTECDHLFPVSTLVA